LLILKEGHINSKRPERFSNLLVKAFNEIVWKQEMVDNLDANR